MGYNPYNSYFELIERILRDGLSVAEPKLRAIEFISLSEFRDAQADKYFTDIPGWNKSTQTFIELTAEAIFNCISELSESLNTSPSILPSTYTDYYELAEGILLTGINEVYNGTRSGWVSPSLFRDLLTEKHFNEVPQWDPDTTTFVQLTADAMSSCQDEVNEIRRTHLPNRSHNQLNNHFEARGN